VKAPGKKTHLDKIPEFVIPGHFGVIKWEPTQSAGGVLLVIGTPERSGKKRKNQAAIDGIVQGKGSWVRLDF